MIRPTCPLQLFGKIIRCRGVQRVCILMATAVIVTGTSKGADPDFLQGVNRLLESSLPVVANHKPESTVRIGPSSSLSSLVARSSPDPTTDSSNETRYP